MSDNPVEKYGMPSGHTQMVVFCSMFLWLLGKSPYIVLASAVLSIIVMFQRYYTNVHTIKQIIAGAVLGGFNAWLFFWGAKWFVHKYV
jgi:membrane-associated phospholipid phosphatase